MKKDNAPFRGERFGGVITNLQRSRRSKDFVLNQAQQRNIEVTAIGASLVGMGSLAMGLLSIGSNTEEEADWVEFEIDGKKMEGWLWEMPMSEGDPVEVVAEKIGGDRYFVYSVRRTSDNFVAIYPHASAGRLAHYLNSARVWLVVWVACYLIIPIFATFKSGLSWMSNGNFWGVMGLGFGFWALISGFLAYRAAWKLRGFARLAEEIFRTYGWKDSSRIDLRKISRRSKPEGTSSSYGVHYFRYNP